MAALLLLLGGVATAAAYSEGNIYPSGHFDRSVGLTPDIVDDFVKEQAPAWNQVVEEFAGNTKVAFGDVLLSEASIREVHGEPQSPGAGGWPTIRYFNEETGYGGKAYPKKTDKAMCDELGDVDYMTAYVTEMGQTSKCSAATGEGCGEKELKYIEKWKGKSAEDVAKQTARLDGMKAGKMKADLAKWINQRLAILGQLPLGKEEL